MRQEETTTLRATQIFKAVYIVKWLKKCAADRRMFTPPQRSPKRISSFFETVRTVPYKSIEWLDRGKGESIAGLN